LIRPGPAAGRHLRAALLFLAALALIAVGVAAVYGTSGLRYFVVDARTGFAELGLSGDAVSWRLEGPILCTRRGTTQDCRPIAQDGQNVTEFALRDGTRLRIRFRPDGMLEIRRQDDGAPLDLGGGFRLARGDLLLLPPEAWRRAGALVFQGTLTVGAEPTSATTDFLIEGRYDVFEELFYSRVFGAGEPELVRSGELRRGDIVAFREEAGDTPVAVRGFVSPVLDADVAGFHVLAVSSLARTRLIVTSFGSADSFGVRPVSVRPTWTDKAIADPAALALGFAATVLGLLLAVFQLVPLPTDSAKASPAPAPGEPAPPVEPVPSHQGPPCRPVPPVSN
jgi:hypothetical protein